MKKCIALLLILLSMTGIAAIAEADFSSYTDAELREARLQLDSEIEGRCFNAETAEAVCLAFAEYMQELRRPVEYTADLDFADLDVFGAFLPMLDTELESKSITVVLMNNGYEVMLTDDLAGNEAYIRDCMVCLAMAVAQVEGVEIFSNEASTAMNSCEEDFPDGFYSDVLYWFWENSYGYDWIVTSFQGVTVVAVR